MKSIIVLMFFMDIFLITLLLYPNIGKTNSMLGDTNCLECHLVTNLHSSHNALGCDSCHAIPHGASGIASSECLYCHPRWGADACELVNLHENFGAVCFICHPDCEGFITSTTTSQSSTTSIEEPTTSSESVLFCPVEELYGEKSEQVLILRYMRDNVLGKTPEGHELINLYYKWSPVIVRTMEADEEFKKEIKDMIDEILLMISQ